MTQAQRWKLAAALPATRRNSALHPPSSTLTGRVTVLIALGAYLGSHLGRSHLRLHFFPNLNSNPHASVTIFIFIDRVLRSQQNWRWRNICLKIYNTTRSE